MLAERCHHRTRQRMRADLALTWELALAEWCHPCLHVTARMQQERIKVGPRDG